MTVISIKYLTNVNKNYKQKYDGILTLNFDDPIKSISIKTKNTNYSVNVQNGSAAYQHCVHTSHTVRCDAVLLCLYDVRYIYIKYDRYNNIYRTHEDGIKQNISESDKTNFVRGSMISKIVSGVSSNLNNSSRDSPLKGGRPFLLYRMISS